MNPMRSRRASILTLINTTTVAIAKDATTTKTTVKTSDLGPVIMRVVDAFIVITWCNCLEILVLLFFVFKRFQGLYFWAVVVCAVGIPFYATGEPFARVIDWWLLQNGLISGVGSEVLVLVGAWCMIPAQPLVLWSRPHLVTNNRVALRVLLGLIIAETTCIMVPNCVLSWYGL
jgi:hypothetical protein